MPICSLSKCSLLPSLAVHCECFHMQIFHRIFLFPTQVSSNYLLKKEAETGNLLFLVHTLPKVRPRYDTSVAIFSSFNFMVIFNIASADIVDSQLIAADR